MGLLPIETLFNAMQPDDYQLADFLSDDTFRAWVWGGGLRQPGTFWTDWWHNHPAQQPLMREAQNMLLAASLPDEYVPTEQTERFIEQTLYRLGQEGQPTRRPIHWRWLAAACCLLILSLGGWWIQSTGLPTLSNGLPGASMARRNESLRQITNSTDRPQLVTLTDGSTVLLQPSAQLLYPARFTGRNREVQLIGEAFFRVSHRPQQPFFVLAIDMVTKVLGTSFYIRANEADPISTVEVKTGQVAVFARTDLEQARQQTGLSARSVLVTPNQQVVFERRNGQMNRSLVDEPALLKLPDNNRDFTFTDTPVGEVFATLEAAYGVDIIYDADSLRHCSLTAPLGNETLYDKLRIICQAIGGRYEVIGAQIVVQADGCTE